MELANL